jgi:dethiobiotin synthetase
MTRGVFVTGTDTGCGKTCVSIALIRALRERGLRVAGFKPVAAGAAWRDGQLRNADAAALGAASGLDLAYATVNPYCFGPPIAPHLAAAEAGIRIDIDRILAAFAALAARADFVVVEGAGGWLVPLDGEATMQDLALALQLPVILVVGLRLGCLNHALLSERAILASGVGAAGWIGSVTDPGMARMDQNIVTLKAKMSLPCLGVLSHQGAAPADDGLVLDRLLEPAG